MNAGKALKTALALIFFGIVGSPGFAQSNPDPSFANGTLPSLQSQGQIEFLSGGIGKEQSDAILGEGRSWPLMLELAQGDAPDAAYISDVQVTIKDRSGNTVLDTVTEGPYLLVRLPPGKYAIEASYESITRHRDVTIAKEGNRKITLLWPAGKNQSTNSAGE
jgi:hypothetical protein